MPCDPPATVRQVQYEAKQRLTAGGVDTPELDARVLVQHGLGLTHATLIAAADRPVEACELERISDLLERRLQREPVSRIIGEREFYGRSFVVTPDVLDPRPDTEVLVDRVLELAGELASDNSPVRILDIGTGSGAIIVTLMAELNTAVGMATDISQAALDVARVNADRLLDGRRIDFVRTSWVDGVGGEFDVIVSNPPYIGSDEFGLLPPEVADHDPPVALSGGADGLDAYRALIPAAHDRLAEGGALCVEIGASQAEAVRALMRDAGFTGSDTGPQVGFDLAGRPRIVTGRKAICS